MQGLRLRGRRGGQGGGRLGGRQVFAQAGGDALGGGAIEVANDGDRGAQGAEVVAVEVDQVVARYGLQRLGRGAGAVGVAGVEHFIETACGQSCGLGQGFAQAGDGARALTLENVGGKARLRKQTDGEFDGSVALACRGQRADGQRTAVVVGAATDLGANVGDAVGDLLLVEFARAGVEQTAGEAGEAGLVSRLVGCASGEIDLDVDQRQGAALDIEHAGAGGRRPLFDLGAGERRARRRLREQGEAGEDGGEGA